MKKRLSSIGRSDPRQHIVCSPSAFRIHPLTVFVASARESVDSCKCDARKLMIRDDLPGHQGKVRDTVEYGYSRSRRRS